MKQMQTAAGVRIQWKQDVVRVSGNGRHWPHSISYSSGNKTNNEPLITNRMEGPANDGMQGTG